MQAGLDREKLIETELIDKRGQGSKNPNTCRPSPLRIIEFFCQTH
jgi:hypothetical protein